MADIRNVLVVGDGPVKTGAGLHGVDIGYIWGGFNVQLTIDYAQLHDGWVPIVNPNPWKDSGKQGWVKWSRLAEDTPGEIKLLVTYYTDGRAPLVKVIS
jgi:hypothetical protein